MANPPSDEAIRSFPPVMAIDSCSIWNVLCSKTLTGAAKTNGHHFMLAEYVQYECLVKRRSSPPTQIDIDMQSRLRVELEQKIHFSSHPLDVADLSRLVGDVGTLNRIDRGEIAALALARKYGNGFMTDDYKARGLGESALGKTHVRTTPHLVGHLVYVGRLSDGDIPKIVADNTAARNPRGRIGEFINECSGHAFGMRLRKPPAAK